MIEHIDPQNVDEAIIRIKGLAGPVTLAHIADSHLTETDDRDPLAENAAKVAAGHFEAHSRPGQSMRQVLGEVLQRCKPARPDCLVLTGDMVHFPTWANIDALQADLAATGVSHLYTLGNHDWHYPRTVWNEQTRQEYYGRLSRLACGDPAQQVREIGGVLLVAIDNSNYQASEGQLRFLQQQLATGKPCLLFIHIPVYIPSLMPAVMQRWKAPIMMASSEGWTDSMRTMFAVRATDLSTQAFHDCLTDGLADNLAGIFCGHIHIPHADAFRPGRYQYSPKAGYLGGHRIVRLVPA